MLEEVLVDSVVKAVDDGACCSFLTVGLIGISVVLDMVCDLASFFKLSDGFKLFASVVVSTIALLTVVISLCVIDIIDVENSIGSSCGELSGYVEPNIGSSDDKLLGVAVANIGSSDGKVLGSTKPNIGSSIQSILVFSTVELSFMLVLSSIVLSSIEFMFCCGVNAIGSMVCCVEDIIGINVSLTSLGVVKTVVGLSFLSSILLSGFKLAFVFAGVVSNVLSSSGV